MRTGAYASDSWCPCARNSSSCPPRRALVDPLGDDVLAEVHPMGISEHVDRVVGGTADGSIDEDARPSAFASVSRRRASSRAGTANSGTPAAAPGRRHPVQGLRVLAQVVGGHHARRQENALAIAAERHVNAVAATVRKPPRRFR